jgi:DNA-binding LacI/PurR family transcriptional regulator
VLLGPIRRTVTFAEALRRENVLGFVVWTMALQGPEFGLDNLLMQIAQLRRPIAVLDEGAQIPGAVRQLGVPVKVFSTGGGPEPGRKVARFLLGLGHRKVVWLSPMASSTWSQERLQGIRDEFAAAGITEGVLEECDSLVRRSARRPARDLATNWDMEQLVALLGRGRPDGKPADPEVTRRALQAMETQLWAARINHELREQSEPLFERALARQGVSAWVAANDEVAVHALDYLQAHGRRVPDQVSVVGFDNSNESTTRGLTTYNFNIAGTVHALVSHILDPRLDPWDPHRDPPVEIEGFVTERVTTGRCGAA